MDYFLIISYLLGCVICCIMAVTDFRRCVPVYQTNKTRVLIYTSLFTLVVLVVYIGLLEVLVGVSPSTEEPYIKTTQGANGFQEYRKIAPILLALLYFGASRASIKIGNRDFAFYDKLLQVFTSFLAIPVEKEVLIRELENKQIESLEEFCERSAETSPNFVSSCSEGFGELGSHRQNLKQYHDRISILEEMKKDNESADDALNRIRKEEDSVRKAYLSDLQKVARTIIEKNTSNPVFSDFAIRYFQISPQGRENPKLPFSTLLIRTVAFAILGALVMAATIQTETHDFSFIPRVFMISVGLSFFLLSFLWLDRCDWSIDGTCRVLLIGIVAGVVGSIIFHLLNTSTNFIGRLFLSIFGDTDVPLIKVLRDFFESLDINTIFKGAIMGATSGIMVFIFRFKVIRRINNMTLVFLLLASAGFAVYMVGGLVWAYISPVSEQASWQDGVMISILCITIAMVSNVLHLEKGLVAEKAAAEDHPAPVSS